MLNKILVLIGLVAISGICFSQDSEIVSINWENPKSVYDGEDEILVPSIEGQYLNDVVPSYFYSKPIASANHKVIVSVISTENATSADLNYLKRFNIKVGRLRYEGKISSARREHFAVVDVFPFVMEGATIKRIKSFKIDYTNEKPQQQHVAKDFVTSSVLAPGSGVGIKSL